MPDVLATVLLLVAAMKTAAVQCELLDPREHYVLTRFEDLIA